MEKLRRASVNLGVAFCHVTIHILWLSPFYLIASAPLVIALILVLKTNLGFILYFAIFILAIWLHLFLCSHYAKFCKKHEAVVTARLLKRIPEIQGPEPVKIFYKALVVLLLIGALYLIVFSF